MIEMNFWKFYYSIESLKTNVSDQNCPLMMWVLLFDL